MSTSHTVQQTAGVAPVTTAETVILTITIPSENQPLGADGVYLSGTVGGTAGAGTTAVAIRIRQGSVAGAVVGNVYTEPVTASALFAIGFDMLDPTTSYPTGNTYVVTAVQTGATGNGAGFVGCITSTPSNPLTG
jgi:hypothetical protein